MKKLFYDIVEAMLTIFAVMKNKFFVNNINAYQKIIEKLYSESSISPILYNKFVHYDKREDLFKLLIRKNYIQNNQNVLDLGSGTGLFSKVILESNMNLNLVGIDISSSMIQHANVYTYKSNGKHLFIKDDFHNLTRLSDKRKFDVIVAIGINRFVVKPSKFYETVLDKVKINGLIILSLYKRNILKIIQVNIFKTCTMGVFKGVMYYNSKLISDFENYYKIHTLNVINFRSKVILVLKRM